VQRKSKHFRRGREKRNKTSKKIIDKKHFSEDLKIFWTDIKAKLRLGKKGEWGLTRVGKRGRKK